MRTRFYTRVAMLFVLALSLSANIYSQQTGSARRQPTSPEGSTSANAKASSSSRVNGAVVKSDLNEALSVIQNNYIDGKKLDYNSIFKASINGMLNVLDPHSTYLDTGDFAAFKTEQRSEYYGIGATIGDLQQGDLINTYIRATFQDAPASRAGLRFGDKITAVDGQSMKGKNFSEVRKFLLGPLGTVVKVTVEHAATGQSETVTITRDAVSLPSIPQAYMVRPGVGTDEVAAVWPKATEFGFDNELAAFGLQFGHGLGLGLHERPIISRLNSMTEPIELKEGMVFALETYCPASDGHSAARIEEEVVVTADGPRILTLFPAQELVVANKY